MAKSITVNVRLRYSGDGLDHTDVITSTNTNAPLPFYLLNANGLTIANAGGVLGVQVGAIWVPPKSTSGVPSSSGAAKTLKGAGGDVGIPLDPASPVFAATSGLGVSVAGPENAWLLYY